MPKQKPSPPKKVRCYTQQQLEQRRAAYRRYYRKHREEVIARVLARYHATPLSQQQLEQRRAAHRRYYRLHRKEVIAKGLARYHAKHPHPPSPPKVVDATTRRKHLETVDVTTRQTLPLEAVDSAVRRIDLTPLDVIKYAKTKPPGVSDVRWRIELNRRRSVARLGKVLYESGSAACPD